MAIKYLMLRHQVPFSSWKNGQPPIDITLKHATLDLLFSLWDAKFV